MADEAVALLAPKIEGRGEPGPERGNMPSLPTPRPWTFPSRGLAVFHGCGETARLSHYFLPRLLMEGKRILFLDGANSADPRLLARLARERGVAFERFSRQIQIARAFTCFQLTELIARVPRFLANFPAQVLVVTALPDLYFDGDVRDWDARVAFERALGDLRCYGSGDVRPVASGTSQVASGGPAHGGRLARLPARNGSPTSIIGGHSFLFQSARTCFGQEWFQMTTDVVSSLGNSPDPRSGRVASQNLRVFSSTRTFLTGTCALLGEVRVSGPESESDLADRGKYVTSPGLIPAISGMIPHRFGVPSSRRDWGVLWANPARFSQTTS